MEVLFAAGRIPLDLNNVFVTSEDPAAMVESAERSGFPRAMCAWVKGVYAAARQRDVRTVVAVIQGDCSNTHALMEILESEGVRVVDFAFPYRRDRALLHAQLLRLAEAFGTTLEAAEREKRRLDAIRATVHEIDRLTWETGQVSGAETFYWTVNCSDFLGEPDRFGAEARAFAEKAKARPASKAAVRLGVLGVPPICSDLFDRLAELGAAVVFNEMPRQFAMPGAAATLLDQYASYTYPYDIFFRLEDVTRECRRRGVHGVVHYVQSFCHRQLQDRLIREELGPRIAANPRECGTAEDRGDSEMGNGQSAIGNRSGLPVLTLECDRPGPLDAASRTRLEAFVEMLQA
jgi:benzoyl-CoA reductase/2-hydroxyglutaryl-CoA dehydratase subunit BcrC/BadD/HgdB